MTKDITFNEKTHKIMTIFRCINLFFHVYFFSKKKCLLVVYKSKMITTLRYTRFVFSEKLVFVFLKITVFDKFFF